MMILSILIIVSIVVQSMADKAHGGWEGIIGGVNSTRFQEALCRSMTKEIQAKFDGALKELEVYKKNLTSCSNWKRTIETERNDARKKLGACEAQLKSTTARLGTCELEVSNTTRNLEEAKKLIKTLTEGKRALTEKEKLLTAEMNKLKPELANWRMRAIAAESTIQKLQNQLQSLNETSNDDAIKANAAIGKCKSDFNQFKVSCDRDIDSARNKTVEIQSILKSVNSSLKGEKTKLSACEEKGKYSEAQLIELKTNFTDTARELQVVNKLKPDLAKCRERVRSTEAANRKLEVQLQLHNETTTSIVKEGNADIETCKSNLNQLNVSCIGDIARARNKTIEVRDILKSVNQSLKVNVNKLSTCEAKSKNDNVLIMELKTNTTNTARELSEKAQQVKMLTENKAKIETELAECRKRALAFVTCKSNLTDAENALNETKQFLNQTQSEYDIMKGKYEKCDIGNKKNSFIINQLHSDINICKMDMKALVDENGMKNEKMKECALNVSMLKSVIGSIKSNFS